MMVIIEPRPEILKFNSDNINSALARIRNYVYQVFVSFNRNGVSLK